MVLAAHMCVCVCARAGGDAVESVNQSSASDREAEAAADLRVLSGCRYNARAPISLQEGPQRLQTKLQHSTAP